jgi:hypothetical protein
MGLINRNKLMDKITYLIRAKIYDEIKFEEEQIEMIEKIRQICNEILDNEKK